MKTNRKMKISRLCFCAVLVSFIVVLLMYMQVYHNIESTLMFMIFENQTSHSCPLNSDAELDERLFSEISWYNTDIKYHKNTEGNIYRVFMVSQPKIIHWFWGARCSFLVTYDSYDLKADGTVFRRYANLAVPVTVQMSLDNGSWEMISIQQQLMN